MDQNKNENSAFIHSIETFGTLDGPGIRFVIFMQGCLLHCKYCHNRDTWAINVGKTIELDKLIEEIKRYKSYMDVSGGGVTVSGGEPLLQPKFVTKLFENLKKLNIHTALDTSGSLPLTEDIKILLKYTDLVLLDIKHIDNKKCIELTGMSNENTLSFAKYLSDQNIPVWIRQVLVPGYTDNEEDLIKLKDFISTLKNVNKIELLPYHDLGKYKWEKLGIKYPLENVSPATDEDIKRAKSILEIE